MAFTLPVCLSARILDELGVEASTYAYALIDPTASWNDVLSFLTDWLTGLDACIDGQIVRGTITAIPPLPGGIKGAPVAGSRVEQNGILNFLATGSAHRWGEQIPALSNSASVISANKIVLTTGQPVPNLIGVMLGGSALFEWTNNADQALLSFKDALISFRKYNRQLAVSTWET